MQCHRRAQRKSVTRRFFTYVGAQLSSMHNVYAVGEEGHPRRMDAILERQREMFADAKMTCRGVGGEGLGGWGCKGFMLACMP